ncbi:hypothetical protein C8F01DRAFT_1239586 [Mycena amicta]|nr:hypothetical protein C8F01DRAFT_1239586 [Mycena amicta]
MTISLRARKDSSRTPSIRRCPPIDASKLKKLQENIKRTILVRSEMNTLCSCSTSTSSGQAMIADNLSGVIDTAFELKLWRLRRVLRRAPRSPQKRTRGSFGVYPTALTLAGLWDRRRRSKGIFTDDSSATRAPPTPATAIGASSEYYKIGDAQRRTPTAAIIGRQLKIRDIFHSGFFRVTGKQSCQFFKKKNGVRGGDYLLRGLKGLAHWQDRTEKASVNVKRAHVNSAAHLIDPLMHSVSPLVSNAQRQTPLHGGWNLSLALSPHGGQTDSINSEVARTQTGPKYYNSTTTRD